MTRSQMHVIYTEIISGSLLDMSYRLLVSLPFLGSVLYLTYLHIDLCCKVQCQTTHYLQDATIIIPDAVQRNLEKYIIRHECVRKSIPTASLTGIPESEMLTHYLRHTMATFSTYPPAWGIWYLIKDERDRSTLTQVYIRSLQFIIGERACGVYVVTSRDTKRVALTLNVPESYKGPLLEGMLVVEIKKEGDQTTFINHTIMWRQRGKGSAGVLEGVTGRWMHGLMVRRLVENGVRQLLAEFEDKKGFMKTKDKPKAR